MPGKKRFIALLLVLTVALSVFGSIVAGDGIAPLFPSGDRPDNLVLMPAPDMSTMMGFNWRTGPGVSDGVVQYCRDDVAEPERYFEAAAALRVLEAPELASDNRVHTFSATATGLTPGTKYRYRVGSKEGGLWSEFSTFSTAPSGFLPFSFIYMGDMQSDAATYLPLMRRAGLRHPNASLYLLGGDMIEDGDLRNHWDEFLANTSALFSRKPVAPCMGNHEFRHITYGPGLFQSCFNLQGDFPDNQWRMFNYSFRYGPAYFLVINLPLTEDSLEWLERELAKASATDCEFRIVMNHFPVLSPRQRRRNPHDRAAWVPLFEKYGVDLVLSGHDHSYLRSRKLQEGKPVGEHEPGVYYLVANASGKFYKLTHLPGTAKQFGRIPTYQYIGIYRNEDNLPVLECSTYNKAGAVLDRFSVVKGKVPVAEGR